MARYNDYWASMEENLITVNGVTMTAKEYKAQQRKAKAKAKKQQQINEIKLLPNDVKQLMKNVKVLRSITAYYKHGYRQWGRIAKGIITAPTIASPFLNVVLRTKEVNDKIAEIGPKIAMHIAANKPEFMTVADVDPVAVEREKKVFIESGATAGKPENIVEKMVEGRMKKYYAESVLEEQPFVMDPSKTVKQVLDEAGGKLAGFAYFVLGEGVEKREDNLADEVAKMLK